jgi:hypothetical protein
MTVASVLSESINRPGEAPVENEIVDTNPGTLPPDRHPKLWSVFARASVPLFVSTAFAAV